METDKSMTRPVLRRPDDDNDGLVALPPVPLVRQRLRTSVKEFAISQPGRRAAALAAVWIAATGCEADLHHYDPEEALRMAEADPPGIVIVDLLMPGVDGFEFVSRFRAMPAGRDVPIIVWTVKDLDAAERRRLLPSITALVSKNAGGSHALVEELRRLLLTGPVAPTGCHGE